MSGYRGRDDDRRDSYDRRDYYSSDRDRHAAPGSRDPPHDRDRRDAYAPPGGDRDRHHPYDRDSRDRRDDRGRDYGRGPPPSRGYDDRDSRDRGRDDRRDARGGGSGGSGGGRDYYDAYNDSRTNDPYYSSRGPPPPSRGPPPPSAGDAYRGYDDRAPPPRENDRRAHPPGPPQRGPPPNRGNNGDDRGSEDFFMEVPAEVAKMIVGAGGKAIQALQDRTGALVNIDRLERGAVDNGYRKVAVTGPSRCVDAAADEIRKAVNQWEMNRQERLSGGGDRGGGRDGRDRYGDRDRYDDRYGRGGGDRDRDRGWDDRDRRGSGGGRPGEREEIVDDTIDCPIDCRGLVIGKGGARVKRIEEDTGCRVESKKELSYLNLRGTRRAIRMAKEHIASLLRVTELPPMPPAPPEGAPCAAEVPVAMDVIGKVMGYVGANIKKIQCLSGCYMNWDRAGGVMRLFGEPDVVARGKSMLLDAIEAAPEGRGGGGGGADDRGGEPANANNASGEPRDASAEVPVRGQAGFLIGRAGETVRRMEADTGASLHLDNHSQIMQITGTRDEVERGRRAVEDCIERGIRAQEEARSRGPA